MRRGRRDPDSLCLGDVADCGRGTAIEPDRFLRLAAEMKLPGRACWYSVLPFHHFVFSGMLQGIAARLGDHRADK